jgi:catechol 2,3-dioxygenase-like lactoylglutathione lyase family enzyme
LTITGWDHYTLRCNDLQASWRFYADVLGLRVAERPGMPVPAAIVYLGDMMLIHLFQATPEQEAEFAPLPGPEAKWATGRLHHVALQCRDLPGMRARLQQHGVGFTERTLTAASKHLVLLKDPSGVEMELAFSLEEVQAAT